MWDNSQIWMVQHLWNWFDLTVQILKKLHKQFAIIVQIWRVCKFGFFSNPDFFRIFWFITNMIRYCVNLFVILGNWRVISWNLFQIWQDAKISEFCKFFKKYYISLNISSLIFNHIFCIDRDLAWNKIFSFGQPKPFKDLESVHDVLLNHNNLTELKQDTFFGLKSLQTL